MWLLVSCKKLATKHLMGIFIFPYSTRAGSEPQAPDHLHYLAAALLLAFLLESPKTVSGHRGGHVALSYHYTRYCAYWPYLRLGSVFLTHPSSSFQIKFRNFTHSDTAAQITSCIALSWWAAKLSHTFKKFPEKRKRTHDTIVTPGHRDTSWWPEKAPQTKTCTAGTPNHLASHIPTGRTLNSVHCIA